MKKVLCVIVFAVLALSMQAQKLNYGVRAGMNMTNLNEDNVDYKMRVGFHIGAAVDYELKSSMFLESGLYLTTKGAKLDGSDEDEKYEEKTNIMYLQLPVLFSYKYDLGSDDLKLHGKIGPYFALGLAAKIKSEYKYADESEKETIKGFGDGDDKTGIKRGDAGLMLGVGLSKGNYYVGLNYELGLTNINAYDGDKIHTRNFNISLGYNF